MALSENMLSTDWTTPVRFPNGQNVTLKTAMDALQEQADEAGIPLAFREDTLKTGSLFSKQVEDILIMYNPEHVTDYLRFAIRIQHMGKYAFMHVFNLGGSKNFGHDNAANAGSSLRKVANLIGGHNAKLQAEEQYYAILKDCIDNVVS